MQVLGRISRFTVMRQHINISMYTLTENKTLFYCRDVQTERNNIVHVNKLVTGKGFDYMIN